MREQKARRHIAIVGIAMGMFTFFFVPLGLAQSQTTLRSRARSQNRFTPALAEQIIRIAREEGLDPFLTLEVMRVESGFNRRARSPKGAKGLMQMIPATAMRFGITNPYNPEQAIRGGCKYLKFLSDRYSDRLELVLAAYNAGEGAVDKHGRHIPPYRETREYVASVMRGYRRAKQIEEAVFRKERVPRLRAHYVSSRDYYQPSKRNTNTDAQVRRRIEALGRIPRLGRISYMEAQR